MFGITVFVGSRPFELLPLYRSRAEAERWAQQHVTPWGLAFEVHAA